VKPHLLITAVPGAGKTTAIRRVAEQYGVDLAAIDAAVETALAPRRGLALYLVDEIGKMECLSERFVARVRALLAGRVPVVATVAKRGAGFIAEVKRRDDCEVWTLTRANRDVLPFEIINRTH
jgi:nucleoside-triphosphatase